MTQMAHDFTPARKLTVEERKAILQYCGYASTDETKQIPDHAVYKLQLKQTLLKYVALGSEINTISTKLKIMASMMSVHRQPSCMLINEQLFDIYAKELCAWFSVPFGLIGTSKYECLKPTANPETLIKKDLFSVSKPAVLIKKLPNCLTTITLPVYMTPGSAGFDLQSAEGVLLSPGERKVVRTGVAIQIPEGYEMQIRPRSGLAAKHGITVVNAPGTIDSDYRGEIMVILLNTDQNLAFTINPGDRIAQAVVAPVVQAELRFVEDLTATERGEGGFGSTGV